MNLFPFGVPRKILMSPWTANLASVTGVLRTSSHTQGLASAEVSLMPTSTSLTWCGRRQEWRSSHSVATWRPMNMAPVFVPTSTWWKAVAKVAFTSECGSTPPTSSASTRCPVEGLTVPLESPGHSGQSPHWSSHHIHPHKLQNKEHVTWPCTEPSSSSPATKRPTSPRRGALLSLMRLSLKTWWLRSSSFQMAVGLNAPLIWSPGQMVGPALLLTPTNKS